jgi:hypothetical protein
MRSLSDTFAGIAPASVVAFITAQLLGMLAAVILGRCAAELISRRAAFSQWKWLKGLNLGRAAKKRGCW